jgi:uncharacterized protein YceK
MSKAKIAMALAVAATLASGCASVVNTTASEVAGVGGAAVASAITNNGAVATGIGLGVQAATRAGVQYAQRRVHQSVQNEIARAAGALGVGDVGRWHIDPAGALEREQQGRVTVSRVISTTDLTCKEAVFSVDAVRDNVPKTSFFVAIVCQDGERWKWASAEPSTERWDGLQ